MQSTKLGWDETDKIEDDSTKYWLKSCREGRSLHSAVRVVNGVLWTEDRTAETRVRSGPEESVGSELQYLECGRKGCHLKAFVVRDCKKVTILGGGIE